MLWFAFCSLLFCFDARYFLEDSIQLIRAKLEPTSSSVWAFFGVSDMNSVEEVESDLTS